MTSLKHKNRGKNPFFFSICTMTSILYMSIVFILTLTGITSPDFSQNSAKNILHWISRKDMWPLGEYFGKGNEVFVANNCTYTNCYIHLNHYPRSRNYSASLAFDAIIINGLHLNSLGPQRMPRHRRPEQIFIFLLLESASRQPICSSGFDDFFNWTITYRLDSDIPWPYFKVKTVGDHRAVGPAKRVRWIPRKQVKEISKDLKEIVRRKSKIAAWFVSHCRTMSKREAYVEELNVELLRLTRQHVDIYGKCGQKKCFREDSERCSSLLKKDYFFYLAMENSFDKDYVTEKFSKGMMNGAVPIVFGGANYTRFAPPGSYIDARQHTPKKLAARMLHLIRNITRYQNYLRWRNHYYYTDNMKVANIACQLCAKLNEDKRTRRYKQFRRWWTGNYEKQCARFNDNKRRGF